MRPIPPDQLRCQLQVGVAVSLRVFEAGARLARNLRFLRNLSIPISPGADASPSPGGEQWGLDPPLGNISLCPSLDAMTLIPNRLRDTDLGLYLDRYFVANAIKVDRMAWALTVSLGLLLVASGTLVYELWST